MLATNNLDEVKAWAHRFFQRAIDEKRDIYLGLKDTVVSGYDGVMRTAIEEIYEQDYKAKVAQAGLSYHYELMTLKQHALSRIHPSARCGCA